MLKLKFRQMMAKLIFGELQEDRKTFGNYVKEKVTYALDLTPHPDFAHLATLKNLQGEVTGSVEVFSAPDVERVAFLSIDVACGMRYFNMHIIPDATKDLPRFNFEGLVTSKGSQLSLDLYSDKDMLAEYEAMMDQHQGLAGAYDAARKHDDIAWQQSKLPHMRAFCSPYFLLAYGVQGDQLTVFNKAASDYFDHWLALYKNRKPVTLGAEADVINRRKVIKKVMVDADPDRDMVVETYGEEITVAIEAGVMP